MLKWVKLYGVTSSGGALTVTSDMPVKGMLQSVEWIDGTLADGNDAVLTLARDDNADDITLLTLTDANNDAVYNPRYPAHDSAGASVTHDGTNEIYVEQFLNGYLSLTIADGGDTKSGGCIVYYKD